MGKKHAKRAANSPNKKIAEKPANTPFLTEGDSPTMTSEDQKDEKAYEINHPWLSDFKKNRSAYILGFVTICLVITSGIQTCISKVATDAELRAYVGVSRIDTLYFKKPYEMAKISITNSGKTPAKKVTITYIFEYLARDTLAYIDSMFLAGGIDKEMYSLSPGETYVLPVRPTMVDQPDSCKWWVPDTAHNARQVYGKIVYFDNRDVKHRTVFAFQWEFLTKSYRRVGGMNYFDDDQEDPQGERYPFKDKK
ncbi:MAG TPA: hypothetical protein VMF88_00845 [Bacteroidota bacterium]|nr:hypothetical protein [Bacteroidota bacterium]